MINIVNNSFVTRVRTSRFWERKFILFYIQEPIHVFRQFFLKMQLFTLYVLEFFQVASAIEWHKKPICAFFPTAVSPHFPLCVHDSPLNILMAYGTTQCLQELTTMPVSSYFFCSWESSLAAWDADSPHIFFFFDWKRRKRNVSWIVFNSFIIAYRFNFVINPLAKIFNFNIWLYY